MDTQTIGPAGTGAQTAVQAPIKVKYVLYARKSTESEERQILSIDSQVKEMLQIAEREGLEVIDIRRESHSAKDSGQRPVFAEIIKDLRLGRFNGILTWAPDRLSRNAGDLGSLVDLMDQKLLVEIRAYGQIFTNSPSDKFLLMILCSQAKLENDNKSVNVKRGLRMRCEMGLWPAPAVTGYLLEKRIDRKGHVMVDPERGPVMRQMFEKVAYGGWSGLKVYNWLKFELNFRTATGNKHLSLGNIYLLLQNHFYYGRFEYPKGSGNWYQGKHEPLITKELFDNTQEQIKRDHKTQVSKEFAFTKLMTCGKCGSGITAQEKYKQIKSTGGTTRYVYYGCCHSKDRNCRGVYIREDELTTQLIKLIDQMDLNEVGVSKKFKEEMARYRHFRLMVLDATGEEETKDVVDAKAYARYVLKDGTITEKRELMGLITTRFVVKDKVVTVAATVGSPKDIVAYP